MSKLAAEQIVGWINNENWAAIGILILVVFLILICKRVVNTDLSKLTKLSKLKGLRDINTDDKILQKYINDEIEKLLFYKATGIMTNKERRIQILRSYNKLNINNSKTSMRHFRRAYNFFKFENKKIDVHMSIFFKLIYFPIFVIVLTLFAGPLILDIILFYYFDEIKESWKQIAQINIICLGYIFMLLPIFYQLRSVKILQKKLYILYNNNY